MDVLSATFWFSLALVGAVVLWRFSTVLLRQIKVAELSGELQLEQARLKTAAAEQARAVGHLGGRPRETPRPRRRRKDEEEDDEDDDEEEPSLVERAAVQFAAGMGIDLEKAANGDAVEQQKAMSIMKQFQSWRAQNGGASNGALVQGESYL